jgi:hypothetical protein
MAETKRFYQPVAVNSALTVSGAATLSSTLAVTGAATLTGQVTATAGVVGSTPVAFTSGTSLALTRALHAGRTVYVTDVAAAYTLPAATGSGDKYRIVLGATQTGAGTISATSSGTFVGNATLYQDAAATVNGFTAVAGDNTIDLFEASNTTGGMIGASYDFEDIATNLWHVNIVSDAGGTEATPFSTV